MKKKRSKGVTFWGWVFIIFSIIGLLQMISPQRQIQMYGIGTIIFSIISAVAYLVCGIYILKLNEKSRKAAIVLGIISILSFPLYFKPLFNMPIPQDYYTKSKQQIIERMKPEYQHEALERLEKSNEIMKKGLPVILIIIFGIPGLIFELIPIYFFTRPKVKEQFRQSIMEQK